MEHFKEAIKTATGRTDFIRQFNKARGVLVLFLDKNGKFFPDEEIASILGLGGIKFGSGIHIGNQIIVSFDHLAMSYREAKGVDADYLFD